MRTKYQPQISEDLMADIFRAQKLVKKSLKDKKISIKIMTELIRSWQGELGSIRRKFRAGRVSQREVRGAELALGFLKATHQDNLSKYESYCIEQ